MTDKIQLEIAQNIKMITDGELLKLAAKAANLAVCGYSDFEGGTGLWLSPDIGRYWNPLTDDGDAFRLAVQLQIYSFKYGNEIHAQAYWRDDIMSDVLKITENINNDIYEATRRAIVKIAAELCHMEMCKNID